VSGFAGIVRIAPNAESDELDRLAIERMARTIAFRGPDALQQSNQPGASFAFSLLKTGPAPQASAQPCHVDGETWFLGEARCDGRDDLRRKLSQWGVSLPAPATDEELVLWHFVKFGTANLPGLDGDFSFALWKPRERSLIAFRDLTGARSFFYSYRDGVLIFSNTMQAVLRHPDVSRHEYDLQFMGDFLLGSPGYNPENTAYRDVRRLPAGHLLEFSPHGLLVSRIAKFPVEDLLKFSRDEDVIEEFRRLFKQAVADCLPSDDTSIFLSGGLDSTSIAASVVSLRKEKSPAASLRLHALSVDFQPLFDDPEGRYASRFAEAFGIPLQLVHNGDVLPFSGWEGSASTLPEPLMDPYSLLYLSSRHTVSRNSRVLLSGDGGDELLRLRAAPYLRFLTRRHGPITAFRALARWTLSHGKLPPLGFGIRSRFLRVLGNQRAELMFPPWLAAGFARSQNLSERWQEMCSPFPSEHPFNPHLNEIVNSGYLGNVLELYDPVWTGVPLETRYPFLERRLCRFLLRIPPIPWAMNKHLIRISQIGVLPEEIRGRSKTPLEQDPLVLHAASGRWNPVPDSAPSAVVESFVDWRELLKALKRASGTSLYVHLRPVALSLWLNAVEKDSRIL
jgi:asparagine synthase (glutamine-hydrolysing)